MPSRAHGRRRSAPPSARRASGSKVAAQHSGDGIDRGPPGGQPGQALLVHLGRDAEPVGRPSRRAAAAASDPQPRRPARRGAVPNGPGQLAEPVGDDLLPGRHRSHASRAASAPSRRPRRRATRRRRAGRPSRPGSSGRPGRRPGSVAPGADGSRHSSRSRWSLLEGPRWTGARTSVVSEGHVGARRAPRRAISATSIAIASWPICRIGCCTVVSGGCGQRRLGDVVEPDHRELGRDVDAQLGGDVEGGEGGDVVGREDRGRRVGQRRAAARAASRRLLGLEGAERAAASSSTGRPAAAMRLAVALLAQLGGDQVGAAGDHADPACGRARAGGRRPAARPAGCRRSRSAGSSAPVCGSTATIGPSYWTSVTVGVTSTAPSTRVPITRER